MKSNSLDFPAIGDIVWWKDTGIKKYGYVLTVERVFNRVLTTVASFNSQEDTLAFSEREDWGKVE